MKIFETKKHKIEPNKFPYQKRKILTAVEQDFFDKLKDIVLDQYYIFPQVHYGCILEVVANEPDSWGYFNKINRKSADFILVDKQTFETKLVIELDDSTHFRRDRQDRDGFIDQALKQAGITIFHAKGNNLNEIKGLLTAYNQASKVGV